MKSLNCGPCGLYCGACGATDCDGCRSDRVDDWVRQCPFRTCAGEKHLAFCCHCSDFPCIKLSGFMTDKWPHHWTMRPNLDHIRERGVDDWLQAQKQTWSCDACGAGTYWYQRKCSCGKLLAAWDLPA